MTGDVFDSVDLHTDTVQQAVHDGTLLEIDIGGKRTSWRLDEYGAPADRDAFVHALPVETNQLPHEGRDQWAAVEAAWLQPLGIPTDRTPSGNTLPRLDADRTRQWAARNGWTISNAADDVLSVTTTARNGRITLDYRVRETDQTTYITMHGLFRRDTGQDWSIDPDHRGTYLAHVLTDIITPYRDAQVNKHVLQAAEDLPDDATYTDVLDDIRDLGRQYADDYKQRRGTETWLQRKGQLQGLIHAKRNNEPVPDRFQSQGKLDGLAARDVDELEELLAVVDDYADEEYFADTRDDAPVYDALHPFYRFLVDDIARQDSRLRRRDWPDRYRDDDLLHALQNGDGGDAAHHVTAKWEEYIDMFDRRLADTLAAQ